MAASTDSIPGALDTQLKTAILVQRRAILLAILGSTASNNIALKTILSNGVLIVVKTWLDDILNKSVGKLPLRRKPKKYSRLRFRSSKVNLLMSDASESNFTSSWSLEVVTYNFLRSTLHYGMLVVMIVFSSISLQYPVLDHGPFYLRHSHVGPKTCCYIRLFTVSNRFFF